MTFLIAVIVSVLITRWVYSDEKKHPLEKPKIGGMREKIMQEILGSFYKSPRQRRQMRATKYK